MAKLLQVLTSFQKRNSRIIESSFAQPYGNYYFFNHYMYRQFHWTVVPGLRVTSGQCFFIGVAKNRNIYIFFILILLYTTYIQFNSLLNKLIVAFCCMFTYHILKLYGTSSG